MPQRFQFFTAAMLFKASVMAGVELRFQRQAYGHPVPGAMPQAGLKAAPSVRNLTNYLV
jgi:hypothetical protein